LQQAPVEVNPFVVYGLLVLVMLAPVLISFYKFFRKTAEIDRKYGVGGKTKKKGRKK
jgi:membrane protein insertase Oxa1/YidC/SpoIIIJ